MCCPQEGYHCSAICLPDWWAHQQCQVVAFEIFSSAASCQCCSPEGPAKPGSLKMHQRTVCVRNPVYSLRYMRRIQWGNRQVHSSTCSLQGERTKLQLRGEDQKSFPTLPFSYKKAGQLTLRLQAWAVYSICWIVHVSCREWARQFYVVPEIPLHRPWKPYIWQVIPMLSLVYVHINLLLFVKVDLPACLESKRWLPNGDTTKGKTMNKKMDGTCWKVSKTHDIHHKNQK